MSGALPARPHPWPLATANAVVEGWQTAQEVPRYVPIAVDHCSPGTRGAFMASVTTRFLRDAVGNVREVRPHPSPPNPNQSAPHPSQARASPPPPLPTPPSFGPVRARRDALAPLCTLAPIGLKNLRPPRSQDLCLQARSTCTRDANYGCELIIAHARSITGTRAPHACTRGRARGRNFLCKQLQMTITRVADEEYDQALAATPELCRPFAAAMGDRRSAARVRADFDADRSRPLAALCTTPEGRRAADMLAAAIRERTAALHGVQRRPFLLEDGSIL